MLISKYYYIYENRTLLCKADNIETIQAVVIDKKKLIIQDKNSNNIYTLECYINIEKQVSKIIFIENETNSRIKIFDLEKRSQDRLL